MNITVTVNAPELVSAINALSTAIFSTGIKLVDNALVDEEKENVSSKKEIQKEEQEVTIEAVRAVLAAKSQAGKQAAVKALISKYGASKLTEVAADKYAELLAEAEVL